MARWCHDKCGRHYHGTTYRQDDQKLHLMKAARTERPQYPEAPLTPAPGRRFVFGFGVLLVLTGLAKIWSSFGDARLLVHTDPIVGVEFRYLMLATGLLELGIAGICFHPQKTRLGTVLVAWLSSVFLVYRLGLWWLDWHSPCACLGNLTDSLNISPESSNTLVELLLAYLVAASWGLIFWQWRWHRRLRKLPDMLNRFSGAAIDQ